MFSVIYLIRRRTFLQRTLLFSFTLLPIHVVYNNQSFSIVKHELFTLVAACLPRTLFNLLLHLQASNWHNQSYDIFMTKQIALIVSDFNRYGEATLLCQQPSFIL